MTNVKWIGVVLFALLSVNAHARNIVINIDGTNNAPWDGDDDYKFLTNELKDESISNVFKMQLYAGGTHPNKIEQYLPGGAKNYSEQAALYYIGVGNPEQYDSLLESIGAKFESALATGDPDRIHADVLADITTLYRFGPTDAEDDVLYIFGFSRGAAIARRLAQHLSTKGLQQPDGTMRVPKIRLMGLWDTVAAFGVPELDFKDPDPIVLNEENGTVHTNVETVIHMVSIDELRKTFKPTLIGPRSGVTEMWFPGVHSDVGGGYEQDGLSDITLDLMLRFALNEKMLVEKDETVIAEAGSIGIAEDRVTLNPDLSAELHAEKSWRFREERESLFVGYREIKVRTVDGTALPPLNHYSAINKKGNSDYDPGNLRALGRNYSIFTKDMHEALGL